MSNVKTKKSSKNTNNKIRVEIKVLSTSLNRSRFIRFAKALNKSSNFEDEIPDYSVNRKGL